MIEIAFWGQNQPSFQKASKIIYRVHGVKISYVTVMNITKYIGKLVYEHNYNKALEIWNNRANIDMTITKKKGTLYIQADGANYVIALRCMWESDHWDKIEKIVVNEIYH